MCVYIVILVLVVGTSGTGGWYKWYWWLVQTVLVVGIYSDTRSGFTRQLSRDAASGTAPYL
jgi:bacteriorhodopsin